MNNHIRELAEQAWCYANNYIGDDVKPQIMRFQEHFGVEE